MNSIPSSFETPLADEDEIDIIDKMIFKCKQQPIVPLGTLATVGAIALAAKSMKKGDRIKTQFYYRLRIGFQLATIAALVFGGYYYKTEQLSERISREEKLRAKAKLRESMWIEELERKDAEMQARKARIAGNEQQNPVLEIQEAGKQAFDQAKSKD